MSNRCGRHARFACLAVVLISSSSAQAAFERILTYSANFEAHSELSDETTSIVTLELADQESWSKFTNEYNLKFNYLVDHEDNEENDQSEGFYLGSFLITPATIAWDIRADFEVLPEDSGSDIDNFRSQNLTVLSTGPRMQLFRRLRGKTEARVTATSIDFSESLLDSRQGAFQIAHNYPLAVNRSVSLELSRLSTEFDDAINERSDYDAETIRLVFESSLAFHHLTVNIARVALENDSDPPDQDEYGLTYTFRFNSRSSIELEVEQALQTSIEFNADSPVENNSLFESSLLKNDRASLRYLYVQERDFFLLTYYSNEVEPVFGDDEPSDIVGVSASYSSIFSENWRYYLEIDVSENDFVDDRFESLEAALTYSIPHSRDTTSELEISAEFDETDTSSVEDYILTYRLVSRIFR